MSTTSRWRTGAGVAVLGGLVWAAVDRPWLRGGATRAEAGAALPGDDVVVPAHLQATRAVSIAAPPAAVWPWLAQMGYGRAGWYAYDRFDNDGAPSADRLLPELQDLAVGDVVRDAFGPFGFRVTRLEPARLLLFRATIHPITGRVVDPERDPARAYLDLSWAFVLRPLPDGGTRLLVRVRYRHAQRIWVRAVVHGFEVADAVSARRMLRGIRDRAEGHVTAVTPSDRPAEGARPVETAAP